MLSKGNILKMFFCVLALGLFAFSRVSYADWSVGVNVGDRHDDRGFHHDDRHFYGWRDHPHYGLHMHFLPDGYFTVWVGGTRYYYYDGLYYAYVGYGDYVLVNPPVGAYVTAIPPDFHPIIINGVTYYADNGVYYVLTRHHGYKVVEPPVVYVQQPAEVVVAQPQQVVVTQPAPVVTTVTTVQAPAVVAQDTFPINVPNNTGGYTTVVIKRSGKGYMGPQGEFYAEFPKVTQLKAMYVK
jgi:hypothetical protein